MSDNISFPFVTVVMPIRNEAHFITQSLGAVLEQDYPSEYVEILIADGMSDDSTCDIIRTMPGVERVRIINNPRRIQAAGLNEAIQQAKGKYIIRVDGHTVVAPNYIRECVNILQATGASNVGGPMDPMDITPVGKAIARANKSPFAVPSAFHVSNQAQYTDTVYLGAWPRYIFQQVGLFNEYVGVNEDYEFNYRIRKAGGKIYFSPTIRSQYYGRQTLNALARQYFRYGRSKIMTLQEHPKSLRPRQLVSPIFVAVLLIAPIISIFSPIFSIIWFLMLITYILLNLIFSTYTSLNTDLRLLGQISLVFFVIHMAWGLGFWTEFLIRLLKRV